MGRPLQPVGEGVHRDRLEPMHEVVLPWDRGRHAGLPRPFPLSDRLNRNAMPGVPSIGMKALGI